MREPNAERPNIVFILSDDQSTWGVGCYGNEEILTPNLDRLADEGLRFANFFCTSPVCSPARASLLTGKIPSQHGVHDAILGGNTGANAVGYIDGLETYTEILNSMGYYCGMIGKWHLGNSLTPQAGFDEWFAHQREGSVYYGAPMVRDGQPIKVEEYLTDALTNEAIDFITRAASGPAPFYLSLHYTAPHAPWVGQHPEEFVSIYDDCAFDSCPQGAEHPWFRAFRDRHGNPSPQSTYMAGAVEDPRPHLQGYFGAVSAMDRGIGAIIDRLDVLGLRSRTLVCFMSDNGFNAGHHGIWGKGNGTYPQNMYDTSVKVPAIFSMPGTVPTGKVYDGLLSQYDWMPTILDFAGSEWLPAEAIPGRTFRSVLTGDVSGGDDHVVVYDEYGPVRMIRTRQHKYVERHPNGPNELYDLVADPEEADNLHDVPGHAGLVESMHATLEAWFAEYVVPERDGRDLPVKGCGQFRPVWDNGGLFGDLPMDASQRHADSFSEGL